MRSRLSGSSLVLTIVISVILSILSSSLILIAYYNRLSRRADEVKERVNRNFESAMNLVLADSTIHQNISVENIDLFDEGNDSVRISKSLWGIFETASVESFHGKFSKKKNFFYGTSLEGSLNSCLYLADHQRPLSLVGDTKLIGDAYLAKAGLKTSYINQRGFSFNKLIDGDIKISDQYLPVINEKIKNNLMELLWRDNSIYLNNKKGWSTGDSIVNSFKDSAVIFFQNSDLILDNCFLDGKIMIIANGIMHVKSTAILKDVILIAHAIIFEDGFNGRVQALANDSLIAKTNCTFEYPTALILVKKESETLQNRMVIGQNSIIEGLAISICRNDDLYKCYMEVGENTKFRGIIYSMGYLNLKTNITGIVLTDFFIYKTPSTTYENHLVDIEINRASLSYYFMASSFINSNGKRGVLQWIK